jgi:hypothetical protein
MVATVAPWRRNAPAQITELNIITKDKFLAVFVHMQANAKKEVERKEAFTPEAFIPVACPAAIMVPSDGKSEATTSVAASAMIVAPPPGLELPDGPTVREYGQDSEATTPPREELHAESYQVLLRNVPKSMAHEAMMCVVLEQANLDGDVIGLDFRPGGKVLITFSTYQSMEQCILHFDGRPWGAGCCISALYVRTVKKPTASSESADLIPAYAPVVLSAAAPVFVPSPPEKAVDSDRSDRFLSDVSTQASPLSSPLLTSKEEPCGIAFGELEFELTQIVV